MIINMFRAPKDRLTDDAIRALPVGRDAKDIAHYLASKPDGWRVVTEVCMGMIGRGERNTRRGIGELIAVGLVERMTMHDAIATGRLCGVWLYDRFGPGRHRVAFCCNPEDPDAIAAAEAGYRLVTTENVRIPWSVQDHGKQPREGFPKRVARVAAGAAGTQFGDGKICRDFKEDIVHMPLAQTKVLTLSPGAQDALRASPRQEQETLRGGERLTATAGREETGGQKAKSNGWRPYSTPVGAHRDALITAYRMWDMRDLGRRYGSEDEAWRAAAVEIKKAIADRAIPKRLYGKFRAIAESLAAKGLDPATEPRVTYLDIALRMHDEGTEGFKERETARYREWHDREMRKLEIQPSWY